MITLLFEISRPSPRPFSASSMTVAFLPLTTKTTVDERTRQACSASANNEHQPLNNAQQPRAHLLEFALKLCSTRPRREIRNLEHRLHEQRQFVNGWNG